MSADKGCPGQACAIVETLKKWFEALSQLVEAIDTSELGSALSRREFRMDNSKEQPDAALDTIDDFLRDASVDLARALAPIDENNLENDCARRISDRFAHVSQTLSNISDAQSEVSQATRDGLIGEIHELLREIVIRC